MVKAFYYFIPTVVSSFLNNQIGVFKSLLINIESDFLDLNGIFIGHMAFSLVVATYYETHQS